MSWPVSLPVMVHKCLQLVLVTCVSHAYTIYCAYISTALLASLVTASGSSASLLVGVESGLTRAIVRYKLTRVEKKYFLNNAEASLLAFIRQWHLFSQLRYVLSLHFVQ